MKFTLVVKVWSKHKDGCVVVRFEGIVSAQSLPRVNELLELPIDYCSPCGDSFKVTTVVHELNLKGIFFPRVYCHVERDYTDSDYRLEADLHEWRDHVVPRFKQFMKDFKVTYDLRITQGTLGYMDDHE